MTKVQKIWMWIFVAMFALPEILFFTTPLFVLSFLNNFSGMNINPPIYFLIDSQFFTDHPIFPLLATIIEWVGVLGLLVISIKYRKKLLAVLLGIILLWLSLSLFIGYTIGISMSLF